jgi:tetratricopeptide (TPR) repeat protein
MVEPTCQGVLETSRDSADSAEPQAPTSAVAESQQQDETPNPPPSSTTATTPTPTPTTKEDWEIERDHAKEQGDQAFRMGGYRTAIDHYSHAIELDPDFVVAYSNRSAAYLKNNEKSKALHDAERVTDLDPQLSKGWSRRAAALHALKRWPHALEAYQKVLELDVTNAVAQKGLVECQTELDKAEAQRKRFDEEETLKEGVLAEVAPPNDENPNEEAKGEDEEEDDLLNGFFEEVEEVTKKKEPEPEAATNKVKNEKETLGSAQEQMDRLLQANYEWRNLNPYYVLQLSHVSPGYIPVCRRDLECSERMHRTHRPRLFVCYVHHDRRPREMKSIVGTRPCPCYCTPTRIETIREPS